MFDNELVLSDAQAITVSAASTKYLEEDACINTGHTMLLEVLVNTDFACATSGATVTIAVQKASDSAFTSPVTLVQSADIDYSELVAGRQPLAIPIPFDPDVNNKFTRVYYTCSATMTAGALTAAITPYAQTNEPADV